jgi:hypothetical protein
MSTYTGVSPIGPTGTTTSAEPPHSSSDSASILVKTATVGRQSPFIAAAPASP